MKKIFAPKSVLDASSWRIKVAMLVLTCSAVSLKIVKMKLTAAAFALSALIFHEAVQNWTRMNWLHLAMIIALVYGVVFLSLSYLKSTSEQFLIANGICDKDGKCPRPF